MYVEIKIERERHTKRVSFKKFKKVKGLKVRSYILKATSYKYKAGQAYSTDR